MAISHPAKIPRNRAVPKLTVAVDAPRRLEPFVDLIADELNVKSVELTDAIDTYGRFELTVVPSVLGARSLRRRLLPAWSGAPAVLAVAVAASALLLLVAEVLGALGELRVANPTADRDVLQLARKDAFSLVTEDAGLRRPEHAALRRAVFERYGRTLELAEIG